jgi:anthranilate phosphoribosyltransferase
MSGSAEPRDLESFRARTQDVAAGRAQSEEQAAGMMRAVMAGWVPDEPLAAYLVALADKGESVDEIVGSARALRAVAVPFAAPADAVDTCGTGGDGHGTFNISTVAALVAAAAGQPVVKHGNRSASARVGSADLLAALGVATELAPAASAELLRREGFAFLFAPQYHPAARHAAAVRRKLGRPTIFNLVGPLCNPARPAFQVTGAAGAATAQKLAEAHLRLGTRRAFVVTGADGADELTPNAANEVREVADGQITLRRIGAADAGVAEHPLEELRGGDVAANTAIALRVLWGQRGAPRDAVLMNAGLALVATGREMSLAAAVVRCGECIDSGAVAALLYRLRAFSEKGSV